MRRLIPYLLLFLLCLSVFGRTYTQNTWLSGWDTLHPELNKELYLERVFFGAWQDHQGLGSVASQAHLSELTRLPLVWMIDLFFPQQMVRWIFFFFTLVVGVFGMYWLTGKKLIPSASILTREMVGVLSASFYLLNLVTVQQYFVPLEMFAVHFASLPWVIGTLISFLRLGKRYDLWLFGVVCLLSSSLAHTPTLFFALVLGISLFVFGIWLAQRNMVIVWRGTLVGAVIMLVNLFWLLPSLYYAFSHGGEVASSQIHRLFSSEALFRSREYGNIENLFYLKNFLFSWQVYDFGLGRFVPLMREWGNHLSHLLVSIWMAIVWLFAILGFVFTFREKKSVGVSTSLVGVMAVFFLVYQNEPFLGLYAWLQSHFPLIFGELLRFPFTKFSILLIFALTVLMAYAHREIVSRLILLTRFRFLAWFYVVLVLCLNLFSVWPVFTGQFISPKMQTSIPEEYFDLFAWFSEQKPDGRILKLPLDSYWGWEYHRWGYQGAGFTWFGLAQPTLNREFDRWNRYNENAYRQINYLFDLELSSGQSDLQIARSIIGKLQAYNISYVLIDSSVLSPMESDDLSRNSAMSSLLQNMGFQSVFRRGFLEVYLVPEVTLPQVLESAIPTGDYFIDPDLSSGYFADKTQKLDVPPLIFPFSQLDIRSLDSARVVRAEGSYEIQKNLSLTEPYRLEFPGNLSELTMPIEVWGRRSPDNLHISLQTYSPGIKVDGHTKIPERLVVEQFDFGLSREIDFIFVGDTPYSIDDFREDETLIGYAKLPQNGVLTLRAVQATEQTQSDVFTRLVEERAFVFESASLADIEIGSDVREIALVLPVSFGNNLRDFYHQNGYNCDVYSRGNIETVWDEDTVSLVAQNDAVNCNYIDYGNLKGFRTFIVHIEGKNVSGSPLRVTLRDYDDLDNNFEELLYGEFDHVGMAFSRADAGQVLSVQAKSFGKIFAENSLGFVSVVPVSYEFMSQIKLVPARGISTISRQNIFLIDSAYENGWVAFYGLEKLPHIEVNGWQNGWILPEGADRSKVMVFFWPQYLAWGGMGVSFFVLRVLWYRARKT